MWTQCAYTVQAAGCSGVPCRTARNAGRTELCAALAASADGRNRPHVEYLRRGSVAIKLIKRTAAYKPLWSTVSRTVLWWAGKLARADGTTCAAAAGIGYRNLAWDFANDALRHQRERRPCQSWPAQDEQSVAKVPGASWWRDAQNEREFEQRLKVLTI